VQRFGLSLIAPTEARPSFCPRAATQARRIQQSIAASAALRPRDDPGRWRADRLALSEFFNESASLFKTAGGRPICFPVLPKPLALATSWLNAGP